MRKTVLTALLVAALGAPAGAVPPNDAEYTGSCFLVAVSDDTQVLNPPDRWTAGYGAVVVGYSPTPGHNPVEPDVTCSVLVNNNLVDWTFGSDTPLVGLAADVTTFTASDTDVVTLCTDVVTADAHGQVRAFPRSCRTATVTETPPREVVDMLCLLGNATLCALADNLQGRVLVVT